MEENQDLMERDARLEAVAATFAFIGGRGAPEAELRQLSRWRWEIYWNSAPPAGELETALATLRARYQDRPPTARPAEDLIWSLLTLEPPSEPLQPTLYLLGGLPGSGKADLIRQLGGPVPLIINGDETRYFHPDLDALWAEHGDDLSRHTQRWAGEMVATLRDRALNEGRSLVIEGTFRTREVPLAELERFKAAGYRTRVLIAGCHQETARANTQRRGELLRALGLPPRFVPREYFERIARGLVANVAAVWASGLVDELRLFHDGRIVFHSGCSDPGTIESTLGRILGGPPLPPPRAGELLTPVEIYDLRQDFAESGEWMAAMLQRQKLEPQKNESSD